MGQILKFPVQAAKFGFKRARKCAKTAENPNQLDLFAQPCAQILNFVPESSRFEQALMLDERGDPKAAEFYLKAIEEQDCVADAYCNLGVIESKAGNASKAFDSFTASLKHNPRHFEAHYNLGNIYFDWGDFHLAQVHYQMALQIDPSFPNAYFNLALAQAINQEFQAAVAALTRYQKLVSEPEGRIANELLESLKRSLTAPKTSRLSK
jgi:tetratricopeptide (TPR) repeat protein